MIVYARSTTRSVHRDIWGTRTCQCLICGKWNELSHVMGKDSSRLFDFDNRLLIIIIVLLLL